MKLKTLDSLPLIVRVLGKNVMINNARVIQADIKSDLNKKIMLHIIDDVLSPQRGATRSPGKKEPMSSSCDSSCDYKTNCDTSCDLLAKYGCDASCDGKAISCDASCDAYVTRRPGGVIRGSSTGGRPGFPQRDPMVRGRQLEEMSFINDLLRDVGNTAVNDAKGAAIGQVDAVATKLQDKLNSGGF